MLPVAELNNYCKNIPASAPSSMAVCVVFFTLWILTSKVTCERCEGGSEYCMPPKENCCSLECCLSGFASPNFRSPVDTSTYNGINGIKLYLWTHWYMWFLPLMLIVISMGVCALLKKCNYIPGCTICYRCMCYWCRSGSSSSGGVCDEPSSEQVSSTSCYAPPHYSRCSSCHHAPPPYTEVTSKPDLYPLVINYGDNGKNYNGNNYLMVHYFRNYIMRPVGGSLSATSTADSLSSSFLCSAANETNNSAPPPYSCAASLDELHSVQTAPPMSVRSVHSLASLRQQSTEMSVNLPLTLSGTGSEVSSLAGVGTPGSPPRATSPTLELRELLDKIHSLPADNEESSEETSRRPTRRGLYIPLVPNKVRSAPVTPSTHFPPTLLPRPASQGNRKQHMSISSREDGSPLLADTTSDDEQRES